MGACAHSHSIPFILHCIQISKEILKGLVESKFRMTMEHSRHLHGQGTARHAHVTELFTLIRNLLYLHITWACGSVYRLYFAHLHYLCTRHCKNVADLTHLFRITFED